MILMTSQQKQCGSLCQGMTKSLADLICRVVASGNCTGCGGCSLISRRVEMNLNDEGFMRPIISPGTDHDPEATKLFKAVCPGRRLTASKCGGKRHPIFGDYIHAWQASAADPEMRHAGSSGGVITALSGWLLDSGQTRSVIGSGISDLNPSRTVPVRIQSKEDALRAAGSRYAPVCNLPSMALSKSENALVGKPCEASAAYQLFQSLGLPESQRPLLLSFFCAGTSSQIATDQLVETLGMNLDEVASVRYRGNGWPGRFETISKSGIKRSMSYADSWGTYLGRELQPRCKICVDGTGGHADIAVGDFWLADSNGFPLFEERDGTSVLIARTARGHALIMDAADANVIRLTSIELDDVATVQPLQVDRKTTLIGRMLGRLAAGKRVPLYFGYGISHLATRAPVRNLRAAAGMFLRTATVKTRRKHLTIKPGRAQTTDHESK